jgi:hypothetical protein
MAKLQITLTNGAKEFVESQSARAGCSPDAFVQNLLEDLERSVQRRKLNEMLQAGDRQLRQGLGQVVTDQFWERLEKNIDRKFKKART